MSAERRFQTSYRETDTTDPGLVLEDDGTIWQVKPDGTREQIANGGSQPHACEIHLAGTGPIVFGSGASQSLAFDTVQVDTDAIADLGNHQLVIPPGLAGLWGYGFDLFVLASDYAGVLFLSASLGVSGNAWNLGDVATLAEGGGNGGLKGFAVDQFAEGDALAMTLGPSEACSVSWGSAAPPRLFAHYLGSP